MWRLCTDAIMHCYGQSSATLRMLGDERVETQIRDLNRNSAENRAKERHDVSGYQVEANLTVVDGLLCY